MPAAFELCGVEKLENTTLSYMILEIMFNGQAIVRPSAFSGWSG
jgi:hypothetical protein